MPESQTAPRKRSPYEWAFLIRRGHILRTIRNPRLAPAAKQVLIALALRDDDFTILPERPPVAALARHLALAERTVRQAIAELVAEGCLTFRFTGAGRPARADEEVWDPAERPDIAREHAFIRAASALPSRAEHLAMMGRLRDRAVAARRIATAVSAERALGRALGIGARPRRGTNAPLPVQTLEEPEVSLAPPHGELEAVNAINIDRALSPAARHAAIELLLDPVDDPMGRPDDDDFYWSERLAGRFRITVRAARKALAELADVSLIAQARIITHGPNRVMPGAEICIYPGRIAERMRRGTDAPRLLALEPDDPVEAHVRRLEALRDLACDAGLAPTAVAAQHAIGRALDFAGEQAAEVEEEAAAEPDLTPPPAPPRIDVLGFVRHLLDTEPEMGPAVAAVFAELRNLPQPEAALAQAAE